MSHNKTGRNDAPANESHVLSEDECGLVGGGVLSLLSTSAVNRTVYVAYTGGSSNSGGAASHNGFPTLGDMVSKTYFCE